MGHFLMVWKNSSSSLVLKNGAGPQKLIVVSFNKSLVFIFGIWGIINYLLKKKQRVTHSFLFENTFSLYKDYFGKAIKEYCPINVSTVLFWKIPLDIKRIYKILNILFLNFRKGQHIPAIELVWKPSFAQNRVVN